MLTTCLGEVVEAQKGEGTCLRPHRSFGAELALDLRGIPNCLPRMFLTEGTLFRGGVGYVLSPEPHFCPSPPISVALVLYHHAALVSSSLQAVHRVLSSSIGDLPHDIEQESSTHWFLHLCK